MTGPLKLDIHKVTRLTRAGKLDAAVSSILTGLSGKSVNSTTQDAQFEGEALEKGKQSSLFDLLKTNPKRTGLPRTQHGEPNGSRLDRGRWPGLFSNQVFSNSDGMRNYKLYVPESRPESAWPLIVMLHGCTQSPEDFAIGTRMNALAEEFGFLVAYPEQPTSANASKCWNWFNSKDQCRSSGEPSLLAGITRKIMNDYSVDADRVYVAGLSAGGAAAAIMAEAYPDIFSAAGIHSGLACGAAKDMVSAFSVMSQGPKAMANVKRAGSPSVPLILFHGDSDTTVHPSNATFIVNRAEAATAIETKAKSNGGRPYTQAIYYDSNGKMMMENWTVHGAGHAWFGGDRAGSYTDPDGPDASREMVRFFLANPRAG